MVGPRVGVALPNFELESKRVEDGEHFAKVHGRLASLQFDEEAEADAGRRRKGVLPQPELLASFAHSSPDIFDSRHGFSRSVKYRCRTSKVQLNFPFGKIACPAELELGNFPGREKFAQAMMK